MEISPKTVFYNKELDIMENIIQWLECLVGRVIKYKQR